MRMQMESTVGLRINGKWRKQKEYTMTWRLILQLIMNID